MTKAN